ncbi:hypothetical protein PR048_006660 [Dryococelus australis]|uniref:Sodefrin-like factor n=1 Tax=Dryococelus australis TaxID=614101 RepID=A0ABQ9IBK1_9NEOP|nr:hypothetical protein PR048_006660 [Dryococelus australis]
MMTDVAYILASAIDCYQCESTDHKDPFQCNEVLSSDISIEPQTCSNVYDANYCVKLTGRFAGSSLLVGLLVQGSCPDIHHFRLKMGELAFNICA